jgi:hypothetical protein
MSAVGWGRVGYQQEPIHVFNDEYTARPLGGPFTVAWQGFQKHQQESDMDTEWNRWGFRDGYLTARLKSERFQQYGSYNQTRGAWGPVPATTLMTAPTTTPSGSGGILSDIVGAVKKAWNGG